MNRFKFNALRKEFTFIDATIMLADGGGTRTLSYCDGIRIGRATREMLNSVPSQYAWTGSLVDIYSWDKVSFVLTDGTIIADAVKTEIESGSNYAHSEVSKQAGETVLEAIQKLGVEDTLQYIVWTRGGYNVVSHHSQPNFEATIYKPSREFTWQQVIKEAQQKAETEVRVESNF